jgi:hypothetical protein
MKTPKGLISRIYANGELIIVLAAVMAICILLLLVYTSVPVNGRDATEDEHYKAVKNEAYTIGVQAYIYGLAPVIIQRTENSFVTTPGPGHAPVNTFGHVRHLATPDGTVIVSPNSDTLYSIAWLELGDGPMVMHVPDTHGRYYVMQLMDAYTNNFNSVGRRTTGTGEGDFAIVGPEWGGKLPGGVKEIRSPTNTVWVLGRILVNGESDVKNVTALQDQFKLIPLGRRAKPAVKLSPQDSQPNLTFFEDLRVALKNNPPPAREAALMAVFGQIGLGKNETPYGNGLDPAVAAGLERAIKDGDRIVRDLWVNTPGKSINGWVLKTDIGTYGYDYLTRAVVALGGLGANVPEEAVYSKAEIDGDGRPLNGANMYVMHFAKGELPPVDAFWSLTMYNASGYMLVPNVISRYSIGDRTSGIVYGPDGSLDIYIQRDAPAGKESNWLPASDGDFYLILRMYQPKQEVLNGTYRMPPVMKVK